ncbi:MAG: AP2 domain-containing protein [Staphylococcus lugdunensis]|nr:AP2 domain-containing protein [Staphylococcus lugdunensis]
MDIVGKTFNHLTIVEYAGKNKHKKKLYKCKCNNCGNEKVMIGTEVKNGYSKSCGCLTKQNLKRKHGMIGTPIYKKWKTIKGRCFNPNASNYKWYGERGITMCKEWKNDFSKFYEDVGDIPFEGAELDRIDNNGNYEPNNVRWVDHRTNSNNRRKYHNKTGYTGVTYKPELNKYQAQLYKNKEFIYLGVFETAEEAYKAYLKAKEN